MKRQENQNKQVQTSITAQLLSAGGSLLISMHVQWLTCKLLHDRCWQFHRLKLKQTVDRFCGNRPGEWPSGDI